jgi:hypothetical protein
MVFGGRWAEALAMARRAWRLDPALRGQIAGLPLLAARRLAARMRGKGR